MSPAAIFFIINLSITIIGLFLFVIFGQKTVRKLRKNPATRSALGIEFLSGWDIFNVMSALAFPRKITQFLKNSPMAFFGANADILRKYTTPFDRILAKITYAILVFSCLTMLCLVFLDEFGIFD